MSRKIIDEVFLKRNDEVNGLEFDQSFNFMYSGNVQVGYPKIKISKANLSSTEHNLTYELRRQYNAMKFTDEPAMLYIGDASLTTLPEVIALMKAMFVTQLNKNEEFSKAMGNCIAQMTRMCVQGEITLPLEKQLNFTKFQNILIDEVSNFIKEVFDTSSIGYNDTTQTIPVESGYVEEVDFDF